MPFLAAGALLALALLAPPAHAGEAVPHHALSVTLDPATSRLEAVASITLPEGSRPTFRLAPQLAPSRIEADGAAVPLRGRDGVWMLPAGARTVTVRYAGSLPPPDAAPGRRGGADAAIVGPEGSFLPAWSGWMPDVGAARVTFELEVSVPEPQVAVATGRLQEERRADGRHVARFVSERPSEPPSLFAGPYRVVERQGDGPLLRAYLHPELPEPLGHDYLAYSERVIARFVAEIGDYPFSAFHIVSGVLPVGLGFPGMTYIDRRILPLPFIKAQSLAHEILHNWWGNGVEPRYEAGNWAEGLTTYMADYGLAEPARQRAMRLNWLRDYAALPPERDQPVAAFRSKEHDAAQVVGYNKVAFIFHMLKDEIGEDAFAAGIRAFWSRHAHGVAAWDDLRQTFESAAQRRLDGFFAQWLERPGAPLLHLDQATAERGDGAWRLTVQLRQEAPHYDLRVPLEIETEDGSERVHLDLAGPEGAVSFVVRKQPLAVAVDPRHDLFRRLAPGEAPPSLRDVTLAAAAGVVIAAEGEAVATAEALAARLLDRAGRRLDTREAVAHDGALLVIGTGAGLEPVLAALEIEHWAEGPAAAGASGRAWVALRPAGPVLVVAAEDAAALQALSRPLPHYGRDSWIVFEGAKAVRTGSWDVTDNPLRRAVAIRRTD